MIDTARVSELRKEVGADELTEVIELFCEEVEETLQRISSMSGQDMTDDLHFLKGSAINIGMSEVGRLCTSAEMAIRDNPSTLVDVALIGQAYRKARQALFLEIGL